MQLTSISRLLGLFGFAAALLLHPSLAMACFPEWRSFEEVVLTADDVFVGRITSSKTLSAESITNPSTIQAGIDEAQVDVTESLKGTKIANRTVYAVQLGTCSRELVVGSKCLFTTTDQHGFDVIIVATLACETDDVSDNDDGLLLERYI